MGTTNVMELKERKVSTLRVIEEPTPTSHSQKKTDIARRPELDVIIVALTWGIFLYHACVVYSPFKWYYVNFPELDSGPIKEDAYTIISAGYIIHIFILWMRAWHVPTFVYLSGLNAYYALFRRSAIQFRDERVHRLLVPALFIDLVTWLPISLAYFAPPAPLFPHLPNFTYLSSLQFWYSSFNTQQAWTLVYIFIFSQMFSNWFCVFHPNHNNPGKPDLCYSGSTRCCCTKKPFNWLTKIFCCLNFGFKPAATPEEFVSAMKWFLGGPIRLVILPGLLFGISEVAENLFVSSLPIPAKHIYKFMPFFRFPFFSYMLIFMFGFIMGTTDEYFTKTIMKKYRWIYFIVGVVICLISAIIGVTGGISYDMFTPNQLTTNLIMIKILNAICRGLGRWCFIIGSVALAREKFTTSSDRLKILRELSMPFYLIHTQVLVAYLAGAMWIPYLRTLPITVIIVTLLTTTISFLITKSGPLRYFFGLAPPKDSFLPGKTLQGFVPTLIMAALVITHIIIAHTL